MANKPSCIKDWFDGRLYCSTFEGESKFDWDPEQWKKWSMRVAGQLQQRLKEVVRTQRKDEKEWARTHRPKPKPDVLPEPKPALPKAKPSRGIKREPDTNGDDDGKKKALLEAARATATKSESLTEMATQPKCSTWSGLPLLRKWIRVSTVNGENETGVLAWQLVKPQLQAKELHDLRWSVMASKLRNVFGEEYVPQGVAKLDGKEIGTDEQFWALLEEKNVDGEKLIRLRIG